MKTILLVTNIPTPYRLPLFNELSGQLAATGLRLKVVFAAAGYARRRWRVDLSECHFDHETLNCQAITLAGPEKVVFTYTGLGRVLRADRPAVIIGNGFSPATTQLWLRSFITRTPYLIWSGEIGCPRGERGWRRLQRRLLVRRAIGYIAYGSRAREYLVSLGTPEEKIEIAINTVDTDFFRDETRRLRQSLPPGEDRHRLLYVGDLSPRKNVGKLLAVAAALAGRRTDFVLDLVGDGPERLRLEAETERAGLAGLVKFHGFQPKEKLPAFFARASCFLFQTDFDVWGLVLVEAMAAGLPCLASIHAGATVDLVREGETGFRTDFADSRGVAETIGRLLDRPEEATMVGQCAARFIEEQASLKCSSEGFVRAVRKVLDESCQLPTVCCQPEDKDFS